jgi:hypothetical protein
MTKNPKQTTPNASQPFIGKMAGADEAQNLRCDEPLSA